MTNLPDLLKRVVHALNDEGVEFLLIGGMAVNYYGYTRSTADIDFMLAIEDAGRVRQALVQAGFVNVIEEENVTFFHWPDQAVRVDILKVDDHTFQTLRRNAKPIEVLSLALRVPSLEDLIAMKFFALKQGGKKRMGKDMVDIVQLAVLHDLDIETDIKPLALRFADEVWYQKIEEHILDWRSDESTTDDKA